MTSFEDQVQMTGTHKSQEEFRESSSTVNQTICATTNCFDMKFAFSIVFLALAVIAGANPARMASFVFIPSVMADRILTADRGGYQVEERGRGGYNRVDERGRGGYNGVNERGRGGYNGINERGRGGYNRVDESVV
jgi:hypothetical protein